MEKLSGENADAFVDWLQQIGEFLPPLMKLSEAQKLWERKKKDEETLKNEKKS